MKRRGFTLIELVMVIVIIGILAAVAIPRFANLRRDAMKAACDGNVGAIRGALAAYYAKTAITPGWTLTETTTGFPRSITATDFLNCFLSGSALPSCPASSPNGGSSVYTRHYTSSAGTVTLHNAGSH